MRIPLLLCACATLCAADYDILIRNARVGRTEGLFVTIVASCSFDHTLEGKNISQINREKRHTHKIKDEIQTILDLEAQGGAQMVYHSMGGKDVERIMRYANTAVASDGGIRAPTAPTSGGAA